MKNQPEFQSLDIEQLDQVTGGGMDFGSIMQMAMPIIQGMMKGGGGGGGGGDMLAGLMGGGDKKSA